MNIVAVCDEGPSLTVLATVFRVNSWMGKALQEFVAENVSMCRAQHECEFFQATDSPALVVL